jgi:hypothetical protein
MGENFYFMEGLRKSDPLIDSYYFRDDMGRKRSYHDNNEPYQPPTKRTLQSSVVMPTIETKSREAILTEMKKSEKSGDAVR